MQSTTNQQKTLRPTKNTDFQERFIAKLHTNHLCNSPLTRRNNSVDRFVGAFSKQYDANPLSNYPSQKSFNTPKLFKKRNDQNFSPPKDMERKDSNLQVVDVLVKTKYVDEDKENQQTMNRSLTSGTLIGFGRVDLQQLDDKAKILHQVERNKGTYREQGDKITNLSRTRLDKARRTHQLPQLKAKTHEIGLENCDKLRGTNLGHQVKRV